MLRKKILTVFIFFLLSLLSVYLRIQYYNDGLWSDEWIGYFFSNTQVPLKVNFFNWLKFEGAPTFNLFIYSIWSYLFGHFYQSIEIGSLAFGILLPFLSFYFFSKNIKKNFFLYFLFITNPFLIYYSGEIRFYSSSAFFSFISIIFFLKLIKKEDLINSILFIIFLFISVSINTFAISTIISFFIFIIFKKKYYLIKYLFIAALLFIVLNYYYLINISSIYKLAQGTSSLNLKFFFGFYFNIFFANKFLGGLCLVIVLFFFLSIRKKLLDEKFEKLLLFYIIIFFGFLIPIIYALVKDPIFFPRHFIYLVPIILLIISEFIYSLQHKLIKKFLSYFIIFYLIVVNFSSSKPYILNKPNPNKIINHLEKSSVKNIFSGDFIFNNNQNIIDISKNIYFQNKDYKFSISDITSFYAYTSYIHSREFNSSDYNFINRNEAFNTNMFWSICLDLSIINNLQPDIDKCKKNEFTQTHNIKSIVIIDNFFLKLYFKK